ncbi:MAG TPA: amidase [Gemmataceae bacterium]|jgi:aspartyl-tRNA(Asn)/glutamyl-tRNA(Gln) amidotransferase subunit A|nr:amidase [Gemmataceae bacterium]
MHTIASAAAAIRQGEITPVELLDKCLARIDKLEPRIRAWVLVDRERARADAVRLADEMKRGIDRGPLHGIPIGVKDLYDVFDWPTAAGSKRWANSHARQDCPAIARLRQAGAVLMGKTVTVAYAAFDPPPTRNPWNAERTPGGSSSGSAAAVASDMCLAALGTQTGGSITRPASYCGVYGLKPTYGSVSLEGVVPFASSFDHGGMIAGSVADLALAIQPIAGTNDPGTGPIDCSTRIGKAFPTILGLPGGIFDIKAEPKMASAFSNLVDRLQTKGWTIEPAPLPPAVADIPRNHRLIMSVESLAVHGERWQRYPDDYPPMLSGLFREGMTFAATDYEAARRHLRDLRKEMAANFPSRIAAYLAPATQEPPPDPSTTGPNLFQAPWSYMGLPTVSLPFAWTNDGLPLCIQVAGPAWGEANLLAAAAELEADIGFEKRTVE